VNVEAQQNYIDERETAIRKRELDIAQLEGNLTEINNKIAFMKEEMRKSKDMLEVEQMALTAFKHMNGM